MRVIVVGMGVQGKKRLAAAGKQAVATVDPVAPEAQYKRLEDVPLKTYDAALVCTPDDVKIGLLTQLLSSGSHLLDTALFWFGRPAEPFRIFSANRFENRAFDHVAFGSNGAPVLQMEITLLSWRNHFYADVFAEKGSAHIQSLCKWGPSTFTVRKRKLPSGRPDEEPITLEQPDPTWETEYRHFKQLCATGESNVDNDIWINGVLADISRL